MSIKFAIFVDNLEKTLINIASNKTDLFDK